VRADNSWLAYSTDPCDLAGYGVAMHEQVRRKLSNGGWQQDFMIVAVPRASASNGADGIEVQPRRRRENHAQHDTKSKQRSSLTVEGSEQKKKDKDHHEPCKRATRRHEAVRQDEVRAERRGSSDRHHRRSVAEAVHLAATQLGTAANALATLAPELVQATRKQQQTSQPLVKEPVQQARHSAPSKETKKLPESAPSQETAGQSDNQAFAVGVEINNAEPKLFDMTLNDYDDYETDFFPGSCDQATDDSGCLSSRSDECNAEI